MLVSEFCSKNKVWKTKESVANIEFYFSIEHVLLKLIREADRTMMQCLISMDFRFPMLIFAAEFENSFQIFVFGVLGMDSCNIQNFSKFDTLVFGFQIGFSGNSVILDKWARGYTRKAFVKFELNSKNLIRRNPNSFPFIHSKILHSKKNCKKQENIDSKITYNHKSLLVQNFRSKQFSSCRSRVFLKIALFQS